MLRRSFIRGEDRKSDALRAFARLLRATLFMLTGASAIYATTTRAQVPTEWEHGAYSYAAQNTSLRMILEDFSNSQGVNLHLGNIPYSVVNGRLRADSAAAFLDRLALEYRFQWFVYNDTLYISPQSSQVTKRIRISADAAPDLKQALEGIGLLEPKFGWGELPDDGVVLVTGPPEYVSLVNDFSMQNKDNKENKEMMVFPLRYASVADRQIKYRDKTLLVPGVASIINELLGKKNPRTAMGIEVGDNATHKAASQAFMDQSDSILSQLVHSQDSHINDDVNVPFSSGLNPMISADVRNNALLVRDDPKRRDQYRALVSQIDIPQKLVEIDALIVDVDRNALSSLSANLGGTFGNVTAGSSMLQGSSTLFVTDYRRLFAQIHALEGEGNASIVANPSVLTLENQPAVIDLSDTAFITATGERVVDIEPVIAGTSLQVVPRAIGSGSKGTVQLVVDIEDGKVDRSAEGEATGAQRATVSTQALVQQSGSLVMGGFHSRETGNVNRRIPILGSIPFIGALFSYTRHETSQRERLFIITPHLVGDQVDPTRYIGDESRNLLSDAMSEVQRRQKYVSMKGDVENAMRDLAEDKIPLGFSAGGEGVSLAGLCDNLNGIQYDLSRSQWYSNRTIQITVGVIKNITLKPLRFDEAVCRDDGVLAVAVWPGALLQPGASAEVYVAWQTRDSARRSRHSLLSPIAERKEPR
ncbi:type III secretion outer membrane pore, YscC/HrcC family [Kosakonia radicincitans YD4]|nr:type III secretion outer membrane pore, YscC/HrcC family [Kosakonia radicincitans YD4]